MQKNPHIHVNWETFDPWCIQQVTHSLTDHLLLQPAQLIELGRRLEARGLIRTHSNGVNAGTPFNNAPSEHPNRRSAIDTLAAIRDAKAWMSLLNVQTDNVYRELVDQVLDSIQPMVEKKDPGMCYRGGWIFVTSPKTITPFHIDKEHNFILQIQGRKTLYVWDPYNSDVVSEAARDRFHNKHSRELIKWNDDFKSSATKFDLVPGMGAYMPSTSPHMVENESEPSITVSFTYYTKSTRRDSRVHAVHDSLRSSGLNPSPVGRNRLLDAIIYGGFRASNTLIDPIARVIGKQIKKDDARYAHAEIG